MLVQNVYVIVRINKIDHPFKVGYIFKNKAMLHQGDTREVMTLLPSGWIIDSLYNTPNEIFNIKFGN